jgi:hypothetical protein
MDGKRVNQALRFLSAPLATVRSRVGGLAGYDFRMKTLFKWPYFVLVVASLITMLVARPSKLLGQSERPSSSHKSVERLSSGPDCRGSWPTNMAFVLLKNEGITNNEKIDFSKTKTVRLASEKTGKDLWHQVYDVTFTEYSGRTIEAIAVHDASEEECSMTGVDLFLVSQHLSSENK